MLQYSHGEEVQLTSDDLARQPQPGRAPPSVSDELIRRAWEPMPGMAPAVRPEYARRMSCLAIALMAMLILVLAWVLGVTF